MVKPFLKVTLTFKKKKYLDYCNKVDHLPLYKKNQQNRGKKWNKFLFFHV